MRRRQPRPHSGPGTPSGTAGPAAPVTGASARLTRDVVTWAGYGGLATWAWFLYGFGAVLPLLRAEEGTSRTVMGLHSLALAAGAVLSGLTIVPMTRRLRRRGGIRAALAAIGLGALVLCLGRSPAVSLPAVLLIGIGGSTIVNTVNATLSDHHGRGRAAALSEANAVAAGVGLVAPLAVGAGVALGVTWRPAVLAVLPLLGVLALLVRRVPGGTSIDGVPPPRGPQRVRLGRRTLLLVATVVGCVGIEFCCTAWSADLLRQTVGLSAGAASAAVTAVVGGMAVGRTALGRLALRIAPARLLLAAFALTAAGWTLTWLATSPVPAMAGLVLTGIGIAGQYPLGMALVLASAPGHGDRASGLVSFGLGLSSGLAPFAIGALADLTSTHTAFLVVPGLIVLALVLLQLAGRQAGQS